MTAADRPDTVVFDVGNVLVDFDPEGFLAREIPDRILRGRLLEAVFRNPAWAEADRGIFRDEEILTRFIRTAPDLEPEIRCIYERSGGTITLFPYAVPWIQELKGRGLRVFVLSNYSRHLYDRTVRKMDFLPLLDGALFSWQCGSIKPEEAIYRHLFAEYGIEPSRAVFLDDNSDNVKKSLELGMEAILFTGREAAADTLNRLLG